jgi:predicted small integral membrane protein
MRRLFYLAVLLVLAPMPVKAQQQASQALTLTVSTGGPECAQAMIPLTVLHSGTVTWQAGMPGANPIAGYNVFRSTRSGGAYSQINSALVSGLTYFDPGLTSGTIYYYVVATVDSKGNQSSDSAQTTAVVPTP